MQPHQASDPSLFFFIAFLLVFAFVQMQCFNTFDIRIKDVLVEFSYFQVVPTIYTDIRGRTIRSNQVFLHILEIEHFHCFFFSLDVLIHMALVSTVLCDRAF